MQMTNKQINSLKTKSFKHSFGLTAGKAGIGIFAYLHIISY